MVKCIWCKEEIPDDMIKQHIAEKHLGIHFTNGAPPTDIDTPPAKEPEPQPSPEPQRSVTQHNVVSHDTVLHNAAPQPTEKPKKRYLKADEIITLLQNTNKQFLHNEVQGCPLTKGD